MYVYLSSDVNIYIDLKANIAGVLGHEFVL